MVHPTTGITISSYKCLMHNPTTAEIWQTAFGKDFGGMAPSNEKPGQKGMTSIFIMIHLEIAKISKNQTISFAHVVVNSWPQKTDLHCIWITADGNLINYLGELLARTAKLTTSKLMWTSVLSTEGANYMCLDINFLSHCCLERICSSGGSIGQTWSSLEIGGRTFS
jgi:hypothetical protein